jgi:hypothetical protein
MYVCVKRHIQGSLLLHSISLSGKGGIGLSKWVKEDSQSGISSQTEKDDDKTKHIEAKRSREKKKRKATVEV